MINLPSDPILIEKFLTDAAKTNNLPIIKLYKNFAYGKILRIACGLGYMDMVKYLMENSVTCKHPLCIESGKCMFEWEFGLALTSAIKNGHSDVVKYLRQQGIRYQSQ